MGMDSKIEWTTHTFNAWRGCTKVSPGCAHCYAEKQAKRNPRSLGVWGDDGTRVVASEQGWRDVLKWDAAAVAAGERHRVFCLSMGDLFEPRPELVEPRNRLLATTQQTRSLDYLFLTKRPEYIGDRVPEAWMLRGWPANVWMGVSVEDRKHGLPRIDELRGIPAPVRFLSVEPLLEELGSVDLSGISWVIVGGESGGKARPMHPAWVRTIRHECQTQGVSFFFKQWGEFISRPQISYVSPKTGWTLRDEWHDAVKGAAWGCLSRSGKYLPGTTTWNGRQEDPEDDFEVTVYRVGKKAAGRLLDGREWSEFPASAVSV